VVTGTRSPRARHPDPGLLDTAGRLTREPHGPPPDAAQLASTSRRPPGNFLRSAGTQAGRQRRGDEDRGEEDMALFMDIHNKVEGLTADAVNGAHKRDLEVQQKFGVDYKQYWFDEGSGKVFCLVEAPDAEAAAAVHREAHGLIADEIVPVREGT
jgi:hypothetical protein